MLKAISFRNGSFKNRQYLKFKEGANLLLGPCFSNHNQAIHLIDCCLKDSEITKNTTGFQSETFNSYAFCKYELEIQLLKDVINTFPCTSTKNIESAQNNSHSILLTGFFSVPGGHKNNTYRIVVVEEKYENVTRSYAVVKSLADKTSKIKIKEEREKGAVAEIQDGNRCLISDLVKLCSDTKKEEKDKVQEKLNSDIVEFLQNSTNTQDTEDIITKIQQLLTGRGIVNFQRRDSETPKALQSCDDKTTEDLKRLIFPFEIKPETGINSSELQLDSKSQDILEEAKLLIHALNQANTLTLCIENPGMTFDSVMQERLRDLFIRQSKKVIIFTAQSTSFVNADIVQNTHVCIQNITSKEKDYLFVNLSSHNKHFIAYEDMKKILLASRVLFVEGESDEILLSRLLNKVTFGKETMNPTFLGNDEVKLLQEFLSTTQIIKQGGYMNKQKCEMLCNDLNVQCFFIFDRNVFVQEQKSECEVTDNEKMEHTAKGRKRKIGKKSKDSKKPLEDTCKESERQRNDTVCKNVQDDEGENNNKEEDESAENIAEVESQGCGEKRESTSAKGLLTVKTKYLPEKQFRSLPKHELLLDQLEKQEKNKHKNMKMLMDNLKTEDVGKYKQGWDSIEFPSSKEFEEIKSEELKEYLNLLDTQHLTTNDAMQQHVSSFYKLMMCPTGIKIIGKRSHEYGLSEKLKIKSDFFGEQEYQELEQVLKDKNIFMWRLGNLEHVINMAIMENPKRNLPTAYKIWTQFPIMKVTKEKERTGKRALKNTNDEDAVSELCDILLKYDEIKRFITFLIDVCSSEEIKCNQPAI